MRGCALEAWAFAPKHVLCSPEVLYLLRDEGGWCRWDASLGRGAGGSSSNDIPRFWSDGTWLYATKHDRIVRRRLE